MRVLQLCPIFMVIITDMVFSVAHFTTTSIAVTKTQSLSRMGMNAHCRVGPLPVAIALGSPDRSSAPGPSSGPSSSGGGSTNGL